MSTESLLDLSWLQSICSTDAHRQAAIGHPGTIQRGDGPWTVATNGYVLAMTRGDHGFPPADAHTPNIEAVFPPRIAPRLLPLGELRALATPWLEPEIPDCESCKNIGTIDCEGCEGTGEIECECRCGHEHETECDACDGEGSISCKECARGAEAAYEPRPVRIGAGLFDLRRFAMLLPHVEGDIAEFRQQAPERVAEFVVGDWTLIVMPMRRADPNQPANEPCIAFADEAPAVPANPSSPGAKTIDPLQEASRG